MALPSRFLLQSLRVSRQAQQSDGFIRGGLSPDVRRLTFWTMTVWKAEAAMRAYQHSGAHQAVMPQLGKWCNEAA